MFTPLKKRVLSIFSISMLLMLLYSTITSAVGIKFSSEIHSSENGPNKSELIIKNQYPTNSATTTISAPASSSAGVLRQPKCCSNKTKRQLAYSYKSKKRRKEKTSVV